MTFVHTAAACMNAIALIYWRKQYHSFTCHLCSRICEELAKRGSADQVAMTQQQMQEIEPQLRFARYQLERYGPSDTGPVPDSPSAGGLHVCPLTSCTCHSMQEGFGPCQESISLLLDDVALQDLYECMCHRAISAVCSCTQAHLSLSRL